MRSPKTQPSSPNATGPVPEGGLFRLLQFLIAMLLIARLLVPAEAAVLGGTLWITQLWFLALVLWGWDANRRKDFRLRWGAADAAVWAIVLGHVISTWYVLGGNGEGRSALNLMWEWVGLGLSFFLIRQVQRTHHDGARLVLVFLAFAVMLGGFGLWQHYVELPRISGDYERIVRELSQLSGPNAQRDAIRLERELANMGMPAHPGSRSLWERRLKSTEPFGTFALANTLAGFLAAWLLVLLDWLWLDVFRPKGGFRFWWRHAAKFAGLVIVGYCLVLTKSRTAWVGLAFGFLVWAILRGKETGAFSRRWLWAGMGLVVGLFFIAWLSGGFDREVIFEAPKSLEYRRQYWTGAWDVVKHHPWLGTGPGNFRQHYLHYKLPGSSEEIADPHNWVLDLWTSGGILALGGFAAMLFLAVRAARRQLGLHDDGTSSASASWEISAWEIGAGLSFFVVLLMGWFSADPFDARLIGIFLGWALAWVILRWKQMFHAPWAGAVTGGLAILVHLLGAGGIEMPAIMQTILLLVVLLEGMGWERDTSSLKAWPKSVAVFCGLAVLGLVLCWQTATKPVWYRTLLVRSGDVALSQDLNPKAAAKWYEDAHAADPYSPEPLERLAELSFQSWRRSSSEDDFEQAVDFARKAISLDPASHRMHGHLGRMYFQKAERLSSTENAKRAADFFQEAAARYPSSSALRAELALALHQAGESEEAALEAARALELDEINRAAGHVDKFLPEPLVETLKEIQ